MSGQGKRKTVNQELKELQEKRKRLLEQQQVEKEERKEARLKKREAKDLLKLKKSDEAGRIDRQKEALILAVEGRPCLWDKSSDDYRKRDMRESGWIQVARELDIEESKAKTMWANLTDQIREIWRNETGKSGDGRAELLEEAKTWKFYKSFEFLRRVYKFRSTDSNFTTEERDSDCEPDSPVPDSPVPDFESEMEVWTANDLASSSQASQAEIVTPVVTENSQSINPPKKTLQNKQGDKRESGYKSLPNKKQSEMMNEKFMFQLDLAAKMLAEPEQRDAIGKFASYLGDTMHEVKPENRRKCQADLFALANAYAEGRHFEMQLIYYEDDENINN